MILCSQIIFIILDTTILLKLKLESSVQFCYSDGTPIIHYTPIFRKDRINRSLRLILTTFSKTLKLPISIRFALMTVNITSFGVH